MVRWVSGMVGRKRGMERSWAPLYVGHETACPDKQILLEKTGWLQLVLTGGQEKHRPDPPLSHRHPAHPVPQERPLVLGLGQEPPGAVPVALQHLQLQAEGGLHVFLHQPPEGLAGLQRPQQPHGLQAAEAASRKRGAAGQVQLPVLRRLVPGAGLKELSRLILQGRPQGDLLPGAEAVHCDAQRLIEEAAGGRREADGSCCGSEATSCGHPRDLQGAVVLQGLRSKAGPGEPPLPAAGALSAHGEGSHLPCGPRSLHTVCTQAGAFCTSAASHTQGGVSWAGTAWAHSGCEVFKVAWSCGCSPVGVCSRACSVQSVL